MVQALVCIAIGLIVISDAIVQGQTLEGCNGASRLTKFEEATCQEITNSVKDTSDCKDVEDCCQKLEWFARHSCYCDPAFSSVSQAHLAEQLQECRKPKERITKGAEVQGIRLFVGVLTAAKNHRARQAIRETWGSHPQIHRLLFFSAKPSREKTFRALRAEAATKQDVVVLPTIWESYHNITYQTLEVLRFAAADNEATHALKADDDSYVRVDMVLERMRWVPNRHLFMGNIENPGGGPHRDPRSQWYVTPEEWPLDRYPPWAHGAGYIISQDIVQEIAAGAACESSNHRMFKLEDISVGAWVEFVGKDKGWEINYVADRAFNYNGCEPYDIVSHYVKAVSMHCMYKNRGECCNRRTLRGSHLRGSNA